MGVEGLKSFLEEYSAPSNLTHFSGQKVGIDAYPMMYSAFRIIIRDNKNKNRLDEFKQGKFSRLCRDFCMRRIRFFQEFQVIPYMVFDGDKLQLKLDHHQSKKRKHNEIDEPEPKIQPTHMYDLIEVLKKEGVSFVVAPYEADAQLAWMARNNVVDAVQSDDSDLVLYGCPKVLLNLDFRTKTNSRGDCLLCELDKILTQSCPGLSREQFVYACLFCKSDYMGALSTRFKEGKKSIKKGLELIQTQDSYVEVINHVQPNWNKVTCDEYKRKFDKVVQLYKHQCIYDMHKKVAAYLTSPPKEFTSDADPSFDFLGKLMSKIEVEGIATGIINPRTRSSLVKKDLVTCLPDFGMYYYSFTELKDKRVDSLPYIIKILLESALRYCGMFGNPDSDVELILDWEVTSQKKTPIWFKPARVLSEVPVSDVVDHSVDGDSVWESTAYRDILITPPDSDKVVRDSNGILYPDSVVGTDSRTSWTGGLGVVGWTVSIKDLELANVGQPVNMVIPNVVGVELCGILKTGVSPKDIISRVAQYPGPDILKGNFVEFYGDGVVGLQIRDRVAIAKGLLDFGVLMSFFPFDNVSLVYLKSINIKQTNVDRVEKYLRANKMFIDYTEPLPQQKKYSTSWKLQLSDVS